jgi:hypothetical protein
MPETSESGAPPQRMSRSGNGDAGDLENGAIIEPKWVVRDLVLVALEVHVDLQDWFHCNDVHTLQVCLWHDRAGQMCHQLSRGRQVVVPSWHPPGHLLWDSRGGGSRGTVAGSDRHQNSTHPKCTGFCQRHCNGVWAAQAEWAGQYSTPRIRAPKQWPARKASQFAAAVSPAWHASRIVYAIYKPAQHGSDACLPQHGHAPAHNCTAIYLAPC